MDRILGQEKVAESIFDAGLPEFQFLVQACGPKPRAAAMVDTYTGLVKVFAQYTSLPTCGMMAQDIKWTLLQAFSIAYRLYSVSH